MFLLLCTVPKERDDIELTGCTQFVRAVALHACDDGRLLLVALGLVSMMLRCMIVTPVELVDRIEMRNTDCFGRQDLSRTYLVHHELDSVIIIVIIITAASRAMCCGSDSAQMHCLSTTR